MCALSMNEIVNLFDICSGLGRGAGIRRHLAQLRTLMATRRCVRHPALRSDGQCSPGHFDGRTGKELRICRGHGLVFGGGVAVSNTARSSRPSIPAIAPEPGSQTNMLKGVVG